MSMLTMLNLREDLLRRARELTGIEGKSELIHAGLEALIARAAGNRLAAFGGSDPNASVAPRDRTAN